MPTITLGGVAEDEITLQAAATLFGVSRDTLERAAKEGRLKARKIGDAKTHPYVVTAAEVARFIRDDLRKTRRATT